MKYALFLLLLIGSKVLGQTTDTTFIHCDSLDVKNLVIHNSWDYHSGDDSTWALPSFNSIGWDTVDSRFNIDSIKADYWKGIGWFRKTIEIDSALLHKEIGLVLDHYGASELFINGKLILKQGTVADNSVDEIIYTSNNKPILVRLDSLIYYTVAIRYSNHLALEQPYLFKRLSPRIGFSAIFKNWKEGLQQFINNQTFSSLFGAGLVGIFISLSVIYLLLFSFYSKQTEYLFYTIFTFSMGVVFLKTFLDNIVNSDLTYLLGRDVVMPVFLLGIFIGILAFLYKIFYGKMIKLMWYLLVIGSLTFSIGHIPQLNEIANIAYIIFIVLSSIEILRVIIISIKHKKPNAWLIGAGVGFFSSFIVVIFILASFGNVNINNLYLVFIFLLSIPISMSIYLARSSAKTNENLELQLINVKKLSDEAIEQEKRTAKLELEAQLIKVENDRKTKELEEARQLQLSMLPKELPQLAHLDIAVYMQTATEVGGDYYDFHVAMDGILTVVIGDATGHGMKAGTMVTTAKSLFKTHAINPDILFSLQEFSRCIKEMNFGRLSMCMTMLKISDHSLQISSAAMPPTYIYRSGSQKVEEYQFEAMPLGSMEKFPYELKDTTLKAGDTILLMSDGLPELKNDGGEMYGYKRICNGFEVVAEKAPEEIIGFLKDESSAWVNDEAPDDDVTFVVIKVKKDNIQIKNSNK